MRSKEVTRFYISLGLLLLLIGLGVAALYVIEDARKSNETAPVFTLDETILNPEASIAFYENRLRQAPNDRASRLGLAQTYLQHAKTTRQEAKFIPKARALLDDILAFSPDDYYARTLKASLFNTLHQFEQARDLARDLLNEEERHAYVYGILVDALVELGEYEAAVAACDRMIELRPGIASYARAAYLRELHGDGEGAIEAMLLAADAGVPGQTNRSWALYQAGMLYLAQNDLDRAGRLFEGILEEHAGYAFAIGGLARLHLLRGAYEESLSQFKTAYAVTPDDWFLEGQLEAYRLTGNEPAARDVERRLEKSYAAAAKLGENVRMEYADFLADLNRNLDEALSLARAEYERRPDHLHALETYAWALHKNGRSEEAIPYIERAMRLNTGDAMVHFRAGHIYKAASDPFGARGQWEKALEAHLQVESVSAALEARQMLAGI